MAINRSTTLYLSNQTVVDTGTGIDIRDLRSTALSNNANQTVQAAHTADAARRTWDPASLSVLTDQAPSDPAVKVGWALRLAEDMTPGDDTNCDVVLPAQTISVILDVAVSHAAGTGLSGSVTPTFQAILVEYNPVSDAMSSIAVGTDSSTSWVVSAIGDEGGVFKTITITLTLAADYVFSSGNILFLKVGMSSVGTLPNPLSGTTTYTFGLRNENSTSRVVLASKLVQRCTLADTANGRGTATRTNAVLLDRSTIGKGTPTSTKATTAAKMATVDGRGTATRGALQITQPRAAIGKGTIAATKATTGAKSFALIGQGTPSRGALQIAASRSLVGAGTSTVSKVTVAAKTASVVGAGTPTVQRQVALLRSLDGRGSVIAQKATNLTRVFNLVGVGTASRSPTQLALARSLDGRGVLSLARQTIAAKSFALVGLGSTDIGKFTTVYRDFSLIGRGLVTGRIELPIDEVPEGGGGTTIVKRPMYLFDD